MKRIKFIVVSLLLFAMAACGQDKQDENNQISSSQFNGIKSKENFLGTSNSYKSKQQNSNEDMSD